MSNFLEHHGILGQKWGVRNSDHYPLNPSTDYNARERLSKQTLEYKSTDAVRFTKEQKKEMKEYILTKGTLRDVYSNADLFTTQEMNDAMNRIVTMKRLEEMVAPPPEPKSTKDKAVQFVVDAVKEELKNSAKNTVKNLTKESYNKVVNSLMDSVDTANKNNGIHTEPTKPTEPTQPTQPNIDSKAVKKAQKSMNKAVKNYEKAMKNMENALNK